MRHRRGLRRLRVAFTGDHLTRFGGAFLLYLFFQRLRLRQRLTDEVRFPQRNNAYSVAEMLLALLYPIVLGLERIETTELLQHNGVFQTLTGLPTYPDPTSLRRFLRRFAVRGLPKLSQVNSARASRRSSALSLGPKSGVKILKFGID